MRERVELLHTNSNTPVGGWAKETAAVSGGGSGFRGVQSVSLPGSPEQIEARVWSAVLAWWAVWWPLVMVLALVIAAGLVARWRVRRRLMGAARADGRWVELAAPAVGTPGAARALWVALEGVLHRRSPGGGPGGRRAAGGRLVRLLVGDVARWLSLEVVADGERVRAGVWVPGSLDAEQVRAVVMAAWPGAQAQVVDPPALVEPGTGPVIAGEVVAREGRWTPLIERSDARGGRVTARPDEADPLRGTFTALAAIQPGQYCAVQLIVGRPPRTRSGPGDERAQPWWGRLIGAVLGGGLSMVRELATAVVEVFVPGPSAPQRHPGSPPLVYPLGAHGSGRAPSGADPVAEARRRRVAVKMADRPHLTVTLRLCASGYGAAGSGWGLIGQVLVGYEVAATGDGAGLSVRPTWRARRALTERRPARPSRLIVATLAELAELWHLPADPARYGFSEAVARTRAPSRDLPRRPRRPGRPGAGSGPGRAPGRGRSADPPTIPIVPARTRFDGHWR